MSTCQHSRAILQSTYSRLYQEVGADVQLLHFCPLHMLTFFVWLLPTPLQLSLSLTAPFLISHQKMRAVYLRRAEAIPLSSLTRCFIPKRDLFSKINGESKGAAKVIFTMTWRLQQSQNYPNKNRFTLQELFVISLHSQRHSLVGLETINRCSFNVS